MLSAGNSSAQATILPTVYTATEFGVAETMNYTTSDALFSYDGSGNEQWIKLRVPTGVGVNISIYPSDLGNTSSAFDIIYWYSTSDNEDGSTLHYGASNYASSAAGLSSGFASFTLTNAQWILINVIQYPYSDTPFIIEHFTLHAEASINATQIAFGGYSNDYSTFVPYGFGQGTAFHSTSNIGITSIATIASTSTFDIKPQLASDSVHTAQDISQGGYTTTGVAAAGWNIGTHEPGEPSIDAFGISWLNTTWHRYNLLVAGSVHFFDDAAEADIAAGAYGLTGTLIAVYSGSENADYDDLTLLGSNLTINSTSTNYTAADLTVTLTQSTWLYIQHAFVGDLDNSAAYTYPDQKMSWVGPAVSRPPDNGGGGGGGGDGGTTPTVDTDDGLFLLGATMLGGDVGSTSGTGMSSSTTDDSLLGDWGIGTTMLGGDAASTTTGGGTTPTPTKIRLVGNIVGSTTFDATLTIPVPTPRLITLQGRVLSKTGVYRRRSGADSIDLQPVHYFT